MPGEQPRVEDAVITPLAGVRGKLNLALDQSGPVDSLLGTPFWRSAILAKLAKRHSGEAPGGAPFWRMLTLVHDLIHTGITLACYSGYATHTFIFSSCAMPPLPARVVLGARDAVFLLREMCVRSAHFQCSVVRVWEVARLPGLALCSPVYRTRCAQRRSWPMMFMRANA
eukprot:IDg12304t1